MTPRRMGLLAACALVCATLVAAPGVVADSGEATAAVDPALASLPAPTANGTRPGPPVLYSEAPAAPQLENRDPAFRAAPLLVSGRDAYVDGEYLYQGYLYADHGAGPSGGSGLGGYHGALTYPTDEARYGNNAANLVELRVSTVDPAVVAYRLTLSTMLASDAAIAVVAFDTDRDPSSGCDVLPHDPGAPFPGTDAVLTTWGTGGDWSTCTDGEWTSVDLDQHIDLEARQLTVKVPRALADPVGTWRATAAVGLHDGDGGWLRPTSGAATNDTPGGAPSGVTNGIFDLAFRFGEPASDSATYSLFVGVGGGPDTVQAEVLRANEPTRLAHDIDFDALRERRNATSVPRTGTQVRIFPSRHQAGQGVDDGFHPLGQLQSYTLRIPASFDPAKRHPFTLALHSLGNHHWQYTRSQGMWSWSDRRGAIVASPEARGQDLWYRGVGELDVFEVWNDVARHFPLDPTKTASLGYSMGGIGTHYFAGKYPDLFGRAYSTVGGMISEPFTPPFKGPATWERNAVHWIENYRHVPLLKVFAFFDESGGPLAGFPQDFAPPGGLGGYRGLDEQGYRYTNVFYMTAEHLTLAGAGYRLPIAEGFLDDTSVDRDVGHVTFTYVPSMGDMPELGLVHDHAYWLSSIRLASDAGDEPIVGPDLVDASGGALDDIGTIARARIDAVSHAFGRSDPAARRTAGTGAGPHALPWISYGLTWDEAPAAPVDNALTLRLDNVGSAHYDLVDARLDPTHDLRVDVDTTTPTVLHLDGAFPVGTTVLVDGVASADPPSAITVPAGAHRVDVVTPNGPASLPVPPPDTDPTPPDAPAEEENLCVAAAGESCTFVADAWNAAAGYIAMASSGTPFTIVDDTAGAPFFSGAGPGIAELRYEPGHRYTLTVGDGSGVVLAGDITVAPVGTEVAAP